MTPHRSHNFLLEDPLDLSFIFLESREIFIQSCCLWMHNHGRVDIKPHMMSHVEVGRSFCKVWASKSVPFQSCLEITMPNLCWSMLIFFRIRLLSREPYKQVFFMNVDNPIIHAPDLSEDRELMTSSTMTFLCLFLPSIRNNLHFRRDI